MASTNLFFSLCYHILENNWTLSVKSVTSLNKIATSLQRQQQNSSEAPPQASVHTCPRCDKAYTYKKNLWRHLRFECGRLPTEKCQHCHYVARYKHSLNMHMRTQHPDQSTGLSTARGLFESRGKLVWPRRHCLSLVMWSQLCLYCVKMCLKATGKLKVQSHSLLLLLLLVNKFNLPIQKKKNLKTNC